MEKSKPTTTETHSERGAKASRDNDFLINDSESGQEGDFEEQDFCAHSDASARANQSAPRLSSEREQKY